MDVRDKLLFEPEYAGNFKEKQPPKSSLNIPWTWLPGALCLLQEVGIAMHLNVDSLQPALHNVASVMLTLLHISSIIFYFI